MGYIRRKDARNKWAARKWNSAKMKERKERAAGTTQTKDAEGSRSDTSSAAGVEPNGNRTTAST